MRIVRNGIMRQGECEAIYQRRTYGSEGDRKEGKRALK